MAATQLFPMLSVADVAASRAFYEGLLGGAEAYRFPDEDPVSVTLRFGVSEQARAAGAPVRLEPVVQPWGERMAYVEDPDGNLVMLAQPVPA